MLRIGIGAAWVAAATLGFAQIWKYEKAPGRVAQVPSHWPAQSNLTRPTNTLQLVLLMHPKCPCSRATVEELAKLMAHTQGKLIATVLFTRPAEAPHGWEQTDLWRSAAAIPGVTVIADDGGIEASRFGAATSGQALLYSPNGRLLFAGGITASRGHIGDNAGRTLVTALAQQSSDETKSECALTPVYGCPLFDRSVVCQTTERDTCHK